MKTEKYTIFYTDDDVDDKEIFKEIINEISSGHSIEFQSDGVELLSLLNEKSTKPDILFLDLNMPVKDGFQVLNEIRQSPVNKDIPIVILSTSSDKDTITKAKDSGATLYLCKPNSYLELKSVLSELLNFNWKQNLTPQNLKDFVYYC